MGENPVPATPPANNGVVAFFAEHWATILSLVQVALAILAVVIFGKGWISQTTLTALLGALGFGAVGTLRSGSKQDAVRAVKRAAKKPF
jgi:hypothetical protein